MVYLEKEDLEIIARNPKVFSGHTKICSFCQDECPTSVYNGPNAKRDFDGQPALLMVRPKGMLHYYFCPGQRSAEQLRQTKEKVESNRINFAKERLSMIEEGIKIPQQYDIISRLKTKGLWQDLKEMTEEPLESERGAHYAKRPSGYPTEPTPKFTNVPPIEIQTADELFAHEKLDLILQRLTLIGNHLGIQFAER